MSGGRDTPMFRQYMTLREQVPDAILFFRMGDFYELFFDDARIASELLELTLTSRNKGAADPIPMAGVPHHAARGYIQALVEKGYKVAIADQVEDPKLAKGLVKRDIVRVVSPGVALDPESGAAREACWLVGILHEPSWGLALLDVTTGDLRVTEPGTKAQVIEELGRISPREVVLPESLSQDPELLEALRGVHQSPVHDTRFDVGAARQELSRRLSVRDLSGFGAEDLGPALAAAVAVLDYASSNLRGDLPHLRRIRPYSVTGFMVLDTATRRNLELF
ncbi:MAG: DNA mismatch repair protein MutS, partial [Cognaticolwellia sp.]